MSDEFIQTPLAEVVENAQGAMFQGAFPTTENFAEDPDVKLQCETTLFEVMNWTRLNRTGLEEEWRAIRTMDSMRHGVDRRYNGRSEAFLPLMSRQLESIAANLTRGLFPSDEYFDVDDMDEANHERARTGKAYMQWELETVAGIGAIKPFLRQFAAYGNSPLKHFWWKKIAAQGRRLSKMDALRQALGGAPAGTPAFGPQTVYDGLRVVARSIFYWYVYPATIDSLEEATLVFEDLDVTKQYILDMVRKKVFLNAQEALNAPIDPNHLHNLASMVGDGGGMGALPEGLSGNALGEQRMLSECWTFLKLPARAYLPGEDREESVPVRAIMAGSTPVSVKRNPTFEQRSPYKVGRMNTAPGFFYGHGFGRKIRPMQGLTNDFANQTNDCGTYTLNPVIKRNPAFITGPMRPLAPGVVWDMTDEKGVIFDRPPVELIQYGLQYVNAYIQMTQDMGGSPPVLQGSGQGKGAKTATGMQILQKNAMGPLQDIVEELERQVMTPLLYSAHALAQQYRDKEVMALVGGEAIPVRPEDLAFRARWRWMASSQAANQQQRTQNALGYMQAVMNPIMLQTLQMGGNMVDPVPLLRKVYTDGLGLRNFDQFIKRAPPPPMPGMGPPGMGPPGQEPGAPPQSQDQQSMVAQASTADGEEMMMAPGEGDEAGMMRDEANAMAAMMGGGSGEF